MKRIIVASKILALTIATFVITTSGKGSVSLSELTTLSSVPNDCESASNKDCISSDKNIYTGYQKKATQQEEQVVDLPLQ